MATEVVCDKCGKILKSPKGIQLKPKTYRNHIYYYKRNGDKIDSSFFDLCDECCEEFLKWLDSRKLQRI